ncbi:sigma-70 family RNA polymerase sigma factor [Paludisphaera soli]|uniref:sigma-70 family RNA polymerase sigma factor n=1 Tax=Paludisphaera soli TaxID=2712865 RepID=UPI0013ECD9CE|nr:sigma-70 family RNA polymerase sigma factor [Paludisphaera soli]
MSRPAADRTARRIQGLCDSGMLGAWSDGRLLGRFADGEGVEREDAFAALVLRHGPMVLGVCRRMLGGGADADDAFQAVFLVLARKAGSLRDAECVGAWLRVAAVRTARECRRHLLRLRDREGAPLDDRPAANFDADRFELRAMLDEELGRLPGRYREAIQLCELDGVPRREAASRLGLAEGTLSSRLARGRSLLRDRLARRGLAVGGLGVVMTPDARSATLPDAALRLALNAIPTRAATGTVSEAVASLAEGVLAMLALSRWMSLVKTGALLASLALGAGLAWGYSGLGTPPTAAALPPAPSASSGPEIARGMVVGEAGEPVAGARVLINAYSPTEIRGATAPDGSFAIETEDRVVDGRSILVQADDGRVGAFAYGDDVPRARASESVRIVVKPGRAIRARVADASGEPVAGAGVEVVARQRIVAHAETGADGVARLIVPEADEVRWIVAQKAATGLDYAEFGDHDYKAVRPAGLVVQELPEQVSLRLAPPQTFQVQVVDPGGKPAAGVGFQVQGLWIPGRRTAVRYPSRMLEAASTPDGVVRFDWLPATLQGAGVIPSDPGDGYGTVSLSSDPSVPVVARPTPRAELGGRIQLPDGSPAIDVRVSAKSWMAGSMVAIFATRSRGDGTYSIRVPAGERYSVWVEDEDWAAASRMDVVPETGPPPARIDFTLTKGILLRGVVTAGPERRPQLGARISIVERGQTRPAAQAVPAPPGATEMEFAPVGIPREARLASLQATQRSWLKRTDAEGRYEFRLGPGSYDLISDTNPRGETMTLGLEQNEVVRDFHAARPSERRLVGRVVDQRGVAVPGSRVEVASSDGAAAYRPLLTDAEGRFRLDCRTIPLGVEVVSADGAAGGFVEVGPDADEVLITLEPTAKATGVLLDEENRPRPRQVLSWLRVLAIDSRPISTNSMSDALSITDDVGRFTSPPLFVGRVYRAELLPQSSTPPAFASYGIGLVEPRGPGILDLGEIRVDVLPHSRTTAGLNRR